MSEPMSVEEAARIYERSKPIVDAHRPELEAAEKVLKRWFEEHPDARTYDGRIKLVPGQRTQLDNEAVKRELGNRLSAFQIKVPTRGLALISELLREKPRSASDSTSITCATCGAGIVEQGLGPDAVKDLLRARGWAIDCAGGPRCGECSGR